MMKRPLLKHSGHRGSPQQLKQQPKEHQRRKWPSLSVTAVVESRALKPEPVAEQSSPKLMQHVAVPTASPSREVQKLLLFEFVMLLVITPNGEQSKFASRDLLATGNDRQPRNHQSLQLHQSAFGATTPTECQLRLRAAQQTLSRALE